MPQSPLNNNSVNPAGASVPNKQVAGGDLVVTSGGQKSTLNVTAAAVIKATPGVLHKIIVIAPGTTSGSLVINDLAATSGSAAGNTILSVAFGSLTAGQVITLDWPCATGIAVTGVPGGGSPIYSISFS